ncbi:MAG: 3-oxoacyl-ACP reductase FabG [Ignavibacteriales bacterium]|nr:3-oxoacyl-ACP reductase FabG [Ignavibacteriaceae bacterium]QOJ27348.1 MAG: 3-oxoacyl-ACP reductase FabG [Ignavibacteriales bacterium]
MMRLQGKTAIITGAARGIGKTTAELFASEGAAVILWDRDAEAGKAAELSLKEKGFTAEFMQIDVTSLESVTAAAGAVRQKFGKIDILINNAGITKDATLVKMTEEQWQSVLNVNLTGVFNCTKAVTPHLIENGYGRIINTSSVVGIYGNFGQTNYVATKSGIIGMSKVWARELGKKGITVNVVAPGFIATEMVNSVPEKVLQMMREKTPVGRLGDPIDIAKAYLFLASDDASYVNGAVLSVDGGLVI